MDDQRRKAAAMFGKDFMSEARPTAPARNSAVASQTKANARPIPTYKDGGKVGARPLKDDWGPTIANGKLKRVGAKEWKRPEDMTPREEAQAAMYYRDAQPKSETKVPKKAAGGVGKLRKGQATEPGRGPKMY